jgi:hypothetical protein
LLQEAEIRQSGLHHGFLLFQEGRVPFGAFVGADPAVPLEAVLPCLGFDHLRNCVDQFLFLGFGSLLAAHQPAPCAVGYIDALFLQCRDIKPLHALGGGNGQGAELAGFDLGRELGNAADAHGDMAADDGCDLFATAGIVDRIGLPRVTRDRLHDLPGDEVVDATCRTDRPGHAGRVGLDLGREVGQRLDV